MGTTILITSIGGNPGLSFIKCLRSQNEFPVTIIGTDADDYAVGGNFVDKFFVLPRANGHDYVEKMLKVAKENNVNVIIPCNSSELLPLSKHRKEFEDAGIKVVVSDYKTIEVCNDKLMTNKFFKEAGILAPKSYTPANLPEDIAYPFFLKERTGSGAKNAHKIENREEYDFYVKRAENPVLQELLLGKEYTIDVFCDFNGKPLSIVPRERAKIKEGNISKGRIVNDPKLIDAVRTVAEKLGAIGPINVQCKLHEGEYYFFEINARTAEALVMSLGAGVNFAVLMLKLLHNEPITETDLEFRPNTYMVRHYSELFLDETTREVIYKPKMEK
jgi:carbamoyl-phosphate synthase large subunit